MISLQPFLLKSLAVLPVDWRLLVFVSIGIAKATDARASVVMIFIVKGFWISYQ